MPFIPYSMNQTKLGDCRLIEFRKIALEDGVLTSITGGLEIPFEIKRTFYLSNMSHIASRGNHANIQNQVVLIALKGEFEAILHDGESEKSFTINDPASGLLIREGIWRELKNFSKDAICLVLCSEIYDSSDYIHDFEAFRRIKNPC